MQDGADPLKGLSDNDGDGDGAYMSDEDGIDASNHDVQHYESNQPEVDVDRPSATLKHHMRSSKRFAKAQLKGGLAVTQTQCLRTMFECAEVLLPSGILKRVLYGSCKALQSCFEGEANGHPGVRRRCCRNLCCMRYFVGVVDSCEEESYFACNCSCMAA